MEHLLAPERPVTIGGREYTLDGSFRALKAIQHEFGCEILRFLATRVATLPFDEAATVIRLGIGADAPPQDEIERAIVEEIGITDARRLLGEWLLLAVTPNRDRQKKMAELAEAMATKDSPGGNTANSA